GDGGLVKAPWGGRGFFWGLFFVWVAVVFFPRTPAKLPASPIKTVYITPTSHYDFGFVEPPDAVRTRAARHIDEVIRAAESDPNFRWTIESVWQVDEWLKRQKKPTSVLPKDNEKIARLMNLIKSGQIALSTSWGSMHTDFMGAEELNRLCYNYEILHRTYGINSQIALMDDVPGHPSTIPTVLAGSGTKYLAVGANLFIGVATSLAPGKVPFYWQSPDGSKVLTWISQSKRGGYTEAMTDFYLDPYSLDPYTNKTPFEMFNPDLAGKKTDLQIMEIGVTELLNRYNQAGYKYDAVMAYYAHDFVEPTNVFNLEKAVRLWNSKHKEVQLKIATPPEFLKYIETKYAAQIPTYKGEWSGLWSEAKTQSPRISALARYAHDHAPAAESLWSAISMTRKIPFPVGNFTSIYDLMFTYDEHSGAGNNGWIQLNDRQPLEEQNREYVEYMSKAKNETDFLLNQGLGILAQSSRYDATVPQKSENTWSALVYNGLSWDRNDVVKLKTPRENLRITEIRDLSNSQKIKFDIDENGDAIFVAQDVPSMGYKTFEIITAAGTPVSTLKEDAGETEIKNDNFQIKFRADGNLQSIYDVRQKREIVNDKGELPFNDLLRVEGSDASKISYPLAPEISVKKGEQMTQIIVRRMRSVYPLTVVTIYDNLDRVELHNELDAGEMPFVGGNNNWNDSYYFAFPFNVSKENLKVKRGGQKWFDTLPDDYLPDARRDAVTTQHLFGFTDGNSTALLAHRQSFHWVFPSYVATKTTPKDAPKGLPAMFTGKFPLPEATIYSRAVRRSNQADTHDLGVINMPTVEPNLSGRYIFDYAIAGDGKFDDVRAWHLGANFNLPLMSEYINALPQSLSDSFFNINQPNVQIVDIKPISDSIIHGEVSAAPLDPQVNKIFTIRLQEFAGKATTAQVTLPAKIKSAAIVNLTEDKILQNLSQTAPLTVNLKPFETMTIKVEIE
ncbi:MAG: glycosyl hydrolase-related protein, partial [Pyrinomonadaceae bacterium]